ncbi:MAG TPA: site-specific integrase, partial [Steroidobacteraceae bacterium]
RFYEWMMQNGWLETSDLIVPTREVALIPSGRTIRRQSHAPTDRRLFLLRQFGSLPRPLTRHQARELLARLPPPYDLMARWQLYTGLRVSELLRLRIDDVRKTHCDEPEGEPLHSAIEVLRKGRKRGYIIAPSSLIEETRIYCHYQRSAWLRRASRRHRASQTAALFVGSRGSGCKKNTYQGVIRRAGLACGFRATTHLLRATFACMMLARLEQLAKQGAAINPLLVVKILMGHEHIETTDRYLRAIAIDTPVLSEVLDSLIATLHSP